MVLVNYTTRELTAKLVYYGPGLCGKTTNLQYVYDTLLPPDRRGKMVSLATETDRTLFFDFLPLEIGTIRGLKTRLQLYTVPGQVHYNATRKIVLKGADGIVFVADSQRSMKQANRESFKNMKDNLKEQGLDLKDVPHVIQFNKRDLPDVMTVEEMFEDLNEHNTPFWEAVAVQGVGVEDTLKSVTKLVLKNLALRFAPEGAAAAEEQGAVTTAPPQAAVAPPLASRALPPALPAAPAAAAAFAYPEERSEPAESPLLTSTGELLSLEFDGSGGTPVTQGAQADEDGLLEVGDDALMLEDEEPTNRQAAIPSPSFEEESAFESPAATEAEPALEFGAEDSPFGTSESASHELPSDEPEGLFELEPKLRPEAAVADDAAFALDGLEIVSGADLDEVTHSKRSSPLAPRPGLVDAGETIVMPSERAMPDMEMPDLEGGAAGGDTVLSPVGDLEGLATEADLPREDPAFDELPMLDDLPGQPPVTGSGEADSPFGADEAMPAIEEEMVALAGGGELVDLPTVLSLGAVQGEVEKVLRLPIEWTDASGESRRRSLELRISFRLD